MLSCKRHKSARVAGLASASNVPMCEATARELVRALDTNSAVKAQSNLIQQAPQAPQRIITRDYTKTEEKQVGLNPLMFKLFMDVVYPTQMHILGGLMLYVGASNCAETIQALGSMAELRKLLKKTQGYFTRSVRGDAADICRKACVTHYKHTSTDVGSKGSAMGAGSAGTPGLPLFGSPGYNISRSSSQPAAAAAAAAPAATPASAAGQAGSSSMSLQSGADGAEAATYGPQLLGAAFCEQLLEGDSYKGGSSYSDIRFARVVVEVQDFLTRDRCRGKQPAASRAFTLGLPGSSAVPVTANVIAAADAVARRFFKGRKGGKACGDNLMSQHKAFERDFEECLAALRITRSTGMWAMPGVELVGSSDEVATKMQTAGIAFNVKDNWPGFEPQKTV